KQFCLAWKCELVLFIFSRGKKSMDKESKNYIWWHVIGVTSFLMLPIVLYPHPPGVKNFPFTASAIRDFIANTLMVIFFFLNYYYLIPLLFQKKKYVQYLLIILFSFGLIIYLPSMLTGFVAFIEHFRPRPGRPME